MDRIPFVNRIIPDIGLTARPGAAGEGGAAPPTVQVKEAHEDGHEAWVSCWTWDRPLAKSRMDERLARMICESAFFQGDVEWARGTRSV